LPCKEVNSLIMAGNGDLWLSQPCGYSKIPAKQLEALWSSAAPEVTVETLDVFDGAQSGRSDFAPSATTAPDGTLWFSNEVGVQMIDPGDLQRNTLAPPVHIENVTADHRDYSPSQSLRLPALIRDLEIDYTALSLGVPQRVRFRYKLEGWDKEWQDPGVRRQAFYTNLSPRNYRFRVIASNDEGVWNEGGATLDFNIGAAFYQTTWFLVSCLLASALLLYLLYRFRVRQLAGQIKARMLERLSERERIARDLHDTFFQGIQGLLLRFNSATSQLAFNEPARAVFIETLEQSDRVMLEGRKLVLDLREVGAEVLELPESLARAGEEFNTLDGSEFRVVVVGQSRPLHRMCAGELYLLGREAIYNSFNHANASMIEVELDFETARLRLRITDNGSGIDDQVLIDGVRADHWGLTGMRERAQKLSAKLTIKSRKGAGTEIEVSVPASAAYLTESRTFLAEWYAKWMRRAKSPIIDRHG